MRGKTRRHTGRQVDLELLQHVEDPVDQYVLMSVDKGGERAGPGVCSGMEKVVQRYVRLLLTEMGSVKSKPLEGGDLAGVIRTGSLPSERYLRFVFDVASRNAMNAMILSDNDMDVYGRPVDDERIVSADLVSLDVDRATGSARIHVRIVTLAGSDYDFVVPVSSED